MVKSFLQEHFGHLTRIFRGIGTGPEQFEDNGRFVVDGIGTSAIQQEESAAVVATGVGGGADTTLTLPAVPKGELHLVTHIGLFHSGGTVTRVIGIELIKLFPAGTLAFGGNDNHITAEPNIPITSPLLPFYLYQDWIIGARAKAMVVTEALTLQAVFIRLIPGEYSKLKG